MNAELDELLRTLMWFSKLSYSDEKTLLLFNFSKFLRNKWPLPYTTVPEEKLYKDWKEQFLLQVMENPKNQDSSFCLGFGFLFPPCKLDFRLLTWVNCKDWQPEIQVYCSFTAWFNMNTLALVIISAFHSRKRWQDFVFPFKYSCLRLHRFLLITSPWLRLSNGHT